MTTSQIGKIGEKSAAKYLKRNHYKILAKNIHISHNELDIIARKKNCIVFVEVKTRSADISLYSDFGTPAAAVDSGKIQRTIQAARGYLSENAKYSDLDVRFDVVEIYLDKNAYKLLKINHIENAFGA